MIKRRETDPGNYVIYMIQVYSALRDGYVDHSEADTGREAELALDRLRRTFPENAWRLVRSSIKTTVVSI